MRQAVTLDFHNTLASCDAWFELEVRDLVSDFVRWRSRERGLPLDPVTLQATADAYRVLRWEIAEHGRELTAERCVAVVLDRIGLDATDDEIREGVEALMRGTLHDLAPSPGALDLVRALRETGVPLGIVSNAVYHPFLEWALESFEIYDAFESVVTSASAGYYKSRTEIYAHALDTLRADPAGSVHIGDSVRWDVTIAQRAGMKTVWLNPTAVTSDITPDLEVRSLVGAAPEILSLLGVSPRNSV